MALNREWEMRGNICDAARIAEWVDLDVGRMLKVDTHFTTPLRLQPCVFVRSKGVNIAHGERCPEV